MDINLHPIPPIHRPLMGHVLRYNPYPSIH